MRLFQDGSTPISASALLFKKPAALDESVKWGQLPIEVVLQIAISSVISSQPLVIGKDGQKARLENTHDINIAVLMVAKKFHWHCSKALLAENTWSFFMNVPHPLEVIYDDNPRVNLSVFTTFTKSLGQDRTSQIKRIEFVGPGSPYGPEGIRSDWKSYPGLREIVFDLHGWRPEWEYSMFRTVNMLELFSRIPNLELFSFASSVPGQSERRATMTSSRDRLIGDTDVRVVVVCDKLKAEGSSDESVLGEVLDETTLPWIYDALNEFCTEITGRLE